MYHIVYDNHSDCIKGVYSARIVAAPPRSIYLMDWAARSDGVNGSRREHYQLLIGRIDELTIDESMAIGAR